MEATVSKRAAKRVQRWVMDSFDKTISAIDWRRFRLETGSRWIGIGKRKRLVGVATAAGPG